ncbi:hypothetical protein DFQ30_006506 [Apophysomyces sp. BC1015]|nr:hypothetical protein DFQ30_006506 [Apophysomyces sp. BC1015]KAG0168442.1 hypothetical protein DFQ29_010145 [Apophysomyces sp. BC1021]
MGVHGLTALLSRHAPKSLRTVKPSLFAHQTLAFDASCHLNKFMFGDEIHPHRHIYGFYMLARFCELNNITPIFVFDGPYRLEAKKHEHERRERGRRKVGHSLLYEKERLARLESWFEVSKESYHNLSDTAATRILSQLGDTLEELEQAQSEDFGGGLRDPKKSTLEGKIQELGPEVRDVNTIGSNPEAEIKYRESFAQTAEADLKKKDLSAGAVVVGENTTNQILHKAPGIIKTKHGDEKDVNETELKESESMEKKIEDNHIQSASSTTAQNEEDVGSFDSSISTEAENLDERGQYGIDKDMVKAMEAIQKKDKDVIDQQSRLEAKLTKIAQSLRQALDSGQDTEKYTRTVQALSTRERDVMTEMIRDRVQCVNKALSQIRQDNNQMLISLDLDTLVFGDAPILRYFFSRARPILAIDPCVARSELGLTRDAFVDLCILCGTDFSSTIRGIGPNRALEMIKKYKSIEGVMKNMPSKYMPEDNFDPELARMVFGNLPPIPIDDITYQRRPVDEDRVRYMFQHFEIDPQEVDFRVRAIVLQQNIGSSVVGWGSDPFAANANIF